MSSTGYLPPLSVLRDALIRRLNSIKDSSGILTPTDIPRINALISTLQSRTPTCGSLVSAASMIPNASCGFDALSPLKSSNPLDYSCFQFGQGNLGWHFAYADFGTIAFTLMFFRVEMAPPHILREMNIAPEAGVIYTISAGYGTRGGPWVTLPATAVQGIYECGDQSFSFLSIINTECPWLTRFALNQNKGVTTVDLGWTSNDGSAVGYKGKLTPNKPPIFQGPKGCLPCVGGQGTIYWSFPSMTAEGQVGPIDSPITATNGVGWYDHQWMSSGGALNSKVLQLLSNVKGMFSVPKPIRWLWLTLQLPNDIQYTTSTILSDLPQLGKTYNFTSVSKAQGNDVKYNINGTVTVEEMIEVGDQSYPTKYTINIEGGTYTLQSAFGNSVVYLPSSVLNWEGPGDVLDSTGKLIGTGFLEANQLDTADNLIATVGTRAGIPSSDFNLFHLKKTAVFSGILSAIILFLLIAYIIILCILLIKGGLHLVKKI